MAGVEGLEPPAPGFGELLDNPSPFNSLNTLCKYIGLQYPWLLCSQHVPARVSVFVPFFVPGQIYNDLLSKEIQQQTEPLHLTLLKYQN